MKSLKLVRKSCILYSNDILQKESCHLLPGGRSQAGSLGEIGVSISSEVCKKLKAVYGTFRLSRLQCTEKIQC